MRLGQASPPSTNQVSSPVVGTGSNLSVEEARVTQFDLKDFPLVRLFVSVTDYRGVPLKNLKEENFEIYEGGNRVAEFRFSDEEIKNLPLSILFIIDVSGSMEYAIDEEIEAVKAFMENLRDVDRAGLIKFSDAVIIESEFTENKERVEDALSHLFAFGQTRLYDAIFQGINLMLKEEEARKAIIVLSDGLDNASTETALSVMEAYRSDVLEKNKSFSIFTLGLGDEIDVQGLSAVADATGGKFFRSPSVAELKGIYQTILDQILNEYVIAYESAEKRKGGIVEGEVKVRSAGREAVASFIFRSPGLGSALARLAWPGLLLAGVLFVILLILTFARFVRAAWVTVMIAPLEGKDFPLKGDVNLIGRAEDCGIRIRHDPAVLDHHAEIALTRDGFVLKALSEESLPLTGGAPVKRARLEDKTEFVVGNTRVIMHERRLPRVKAEVSLEELIEAEAEEDAGAKFPFPAQKPKSAVIIRGAHQGLSFEIKDRLTIGRKDADILLPEDRMVSRLHAKLHIRAEEVFIEDLGSTNGTSLNGRRIEPNTLERVSRGDVVKVGETEIRLV